MSEKWREYLSRFLEGSCPREELEALRRQSDLSEESRREIDETVLLADHMTEAFKAVPIPEHGPARLLAVLQAASPPSSLPNWPVGDPRIEAGLSRAFRSVSVPDGAVERLLDRFNEEAETIEASWTEVIDLPEEEGDVRIQFGDAVETDSGAERDDKSIPAPPHPRSGPPPELLDAIPDVRAASRDTEPAGEEEDSEKRGEPEGPADEE